MQQSKRKPELTKSLSSPTGDAYKLYNEGGLCLKAEKAEI